MGTYLVSGVKLNENGAGKVISTSPATLSVVATSAQAGMTFDYNGSIRHDMLTSASLDAIGMMLLLNGKALDEGYGFRLGSTLWQGHRIQLMEITRADTGESWMFQMQGGASSTPISGKAEWAGVLAATVFDASGYQPGTVILPGQFENDRFSDNDALSLTSGDDRVNLGGGRDTVYAGDGNDLIAVSSGHDKLYGGAGDDTFLLDTRISFTAQSFLDGTTISGGAGIDTLKFDMSAAPAGSAVTVDLKLGTALLSGAGHTATTFTSIENLSVTGGLAQHLLTVTGGDGANLIDLTGSAIGKVSIQSGMGNDTLLGLSGKVTVDGGSGNDHIEADSGDLKIVGGSGNDEIINHGSGITNANGGTGNDLIQGGAADDKLFGDVGGDTLLGGSGHDGLFGGDGSDVLNGGDGNDSLFGALGDDSLAGGAGNDLLYGSEGNDTLDGVSGQDTIYGGAGDDVLFGGAGNRLDLYGGEGDDVIHASDMSGLTGGGTSYGGAGSDTLIGNWGESTLEGGDGYDLFMGYALDDNGQKVADCARDTFVLTGASRHGPVGIADSVFYFEVGIDKLDLSELGIAMRLTDAPFTKDHLAKLHYDAASGLLTADIEGKGKIGWMAEVYTVGGHALTNDDFIF